MLSKNEIVELLNRLGDDMDPIADEATKALIASQELMAVQPLFPKIDKNNSPIPQNMPQAALEYFEKTKNLPDWLDPDLVSHGEKAYRYFGPECLVILLFKSLPEGYSMWHIAETLHITGRLQLQHGNIEKLTRRILETLQFVVHVMEPGAFGPEGKSIVTTQKVKFIHATIRNKIVDTDAWGKDWKNPINQEEILMTMLSFSLIIIRGLKQFGIKLSKEDEEGILHLWKIEAFLLGLKEELQPSNVKEAVAMWNVIVERNRSTFTEAGVALTQSAKAYGNSILPDMLDWLPEAMLYFLNIKSVRRLLKIPRPSIWVLLLIIPIKGLLTLFGILRYLSPISRIFFRRFHLMLIKGLILHWNKNQPVTFSIPQNLQGAWSLQKFMEKEDKNTAS